MSNIYLPSTTAVPSVLLIEAGTMKSSEQAAQLNASRFCVTMAATPGEVYLMRKAFHFTVAVLSDTLGSLVLRASAQLVRGQWPKARILILGKVPIEFDDFLYDESVADSPSGTVLLAMLDKVAEDSLHEKKGSSTWLESMSVEPHVQRGRMLQESDPTKVSGSVRESNHARGWPGAERMRRESR